MRPVVLDFDRSVAPLRGELRIDTTAQENLIRYGCPSSALRALGRDLDSLLPRTPFVAFVGSGDFHHVTLPLVRRVGARPGLEVVVLDNHPDNMRFAFGVHCGSWVRQTALLPFVARVDVVGITSSDVEGAQLWANYLGPLRAGKLHYWCVGTRSRWAGRLGVEGAIHAFPSAVQLLEGFAEMQRHRAAPVYLSIDKDVLHRDVVTTNWDHGVMSEAQLFGAIACVRRRLVACDVTGEVSPIRHATGWKRVLSALDGQAEVDANDLPGWQARHAALNERLVRALAAP